MEKMSSNMVVQRLWGRDMPGMLGTRRPMWLEQINEGRDSKS